jgi:Mitochondrial carrier protein.
MKLEDSIVYGGILGQILTLPLDYIKTQHQIYNKSPQSRLVKFIGFETVLLKLFSSSYIKMFLYTNLGHESIINLSLANIAITSFLTPLDHILTKLQTKYLNSELKLKNFYDCSKYIYRQYGLSGFYIGVIPNFLKNLTFSIASALNNRPMLTSHSLP